MNVEAPRIRLSELIAPNFQEVAWRIIKKEFTHWWFKGGRASTKSSFISLMMVNGIVNDPEANAVIFRKFGCDLKLSVFNQIWWAIDKLGWSSLFTSTLNPLEITYIPTGQKIVFKGLDDATKSKSQKCRTGFWKYVWFEELEQYDGMAELRKVIQSLMRGGKDFCYFYSFNPPERTSNWVNYEASLPVPNRFVHTSDYRTVPREWLGEEAIKEAELLRDLNPLAYRHEYLGEVTGTGGTIFTNLVERRITDAEIKSYAVRRKGIDWGWVDPFVYLDTCWLAGQDTIIIFDEIYKTQFPNNLSMAEIKKRNIGREKIVADCAEPKSINEYRRNGFNIDGAIKGQGSREFGLKWLQSRKAIVIDSIRCPNAWREFSTYELEKKKDGEFKDDYPDKNNHSIDALMYSYEGVMEKRGLF